MKRGRLLHQASRPVASTHSARCGRSATNSRTRGEGASTDATNLPKWTQRATDLILVVADLVDEELAAGEERPQLLALSTDFTSTLLNHPERTGRAIERASLRSILLCDIAAIAALA
jgi:hypothetical protein